MVKTNIKRPRISPEDRESVVALHGQNVGPNEIWKKLKKRVSLRSVNTIIKDAREVEAQAEFQFLDTAWHVGLMSDSKYSIAPEALPYLLSAQVWAEKHDHEPVTVRQALWIGHIYACFGLEQSKEGLWHWSRAYSVAERIAALQKQSVNTQYLDKGLREEAAVEVFPDWAYTVIGKDWVMRDFSANGVSDEMTAKAESEMAKRFGMDGEK